MRRLAHLYIDLFRSEPRECALTLAALLVCAVALPAAAFVLNAILKGNPV
ncbi:hypothetical protein [Novosphingobium sp. NBM11]|nr:hypothetical protein [Novosphingobium sp. NBM11]